ncbi:MAG: RpoL/Rpb11 RNA polymerase subunit family protein [Candidatus Bathyarchaeia archaeon]
MKLNIVKREEGRMEVQFGGESHTLLNLIQSSLLEDLHVEMAGYSKPHPLMDRSRLFINMRNGEDPERALIRATKNAKEKLNTFLEKFEYSLASKQK